MAAAPNVFIIFLPGLFAAGSANGQAAPEAAPAPVATVAVSGNAESMRRNDTATRIVVTRADILKYGDTSVTEVMKRLPGVTVANGEVRMRGLGGGYTQILVNGERPPAGFAIESLAPDAIERIEVLRAATAEFSTQAIAGTINVVLRRSASKKSREAKARLSGDGGNPQPGVTLILSDQFDTFNYTGSVGLGRSGFSEDSSERVEERNPMGEVAGLRATRVASDNIGELLNVNTRLHWKLPDAASLTWQMSGMAGTFKGDTRERTSTELGAPYPYPRLDVRYTRDFASLGTDLEWTARIGEAGKLSTRVKANLEDNERFMGRLARNQSDKVVLDRRFATDTRDRGWSWTGKASFPWTERHALALGWDAGHGRYREHEAQDDVPTALGPAPVDFDNTFDAAIRRMALYAQDEWEATSTLSLYLGLRWEGVDTRTSSVAAVSQSRSRVWSPLLQALWKVPGSGNDQLRFALTRTYKAPSLRQLVPRIFQTSFNTAVSPDFTGNPGLRPELAVGADLAYEHFWAGGGMVSASASVRRIDGLVRSAVLFDGKRWVSSPVNSGEALVRGLELEAKFPLKALFAGAPAIDVRASASGNWSRVSVVPGPDNRLAGQNPWSANVGADYRRGPVSAGASLSLVAGGWNRLSAAEFRYVSQRRDLDAYAAYAFDPRRQLRVSASNLLGTDRTNASRYADDAGSMESRTRTAAQPMWRIQYEHKF
ncbi:TonB-dependent receptor plug domain-containing protein [Pseudoduganella sp. GCM10020061]|uniref:TonB-dependent receptor plug domain-containing protein n=1 Tax=Pseudoduganella sp. GCM10020061 TaxID=3317345 RepID=UPI003634611E